MLTLGRKLAFLFLLVLALPLGAQILSFWRSDAAMQDALQNEEQRRAAAIEALSRQQLKALSTAAQQVAGTLDGLALPRDLGRTTGAELTPLAELVRLGTTPQVEASLHLPTKRGDPPPDFALGEAGAGVGRVFVPGNPPRPELAWVAWRRFRDDAGQAHAIWLGQPLRGSGLDAFAAAAGGAWRAGTASGGRPPAEPHTTVKARLPGVDGGELWLELEVPASPWPELKRAFVRRQATTIAFALIFGLLCAWLFSRSIGRPVAALTRAARSVAGGRLDQEVAVRRRDELGQLARAFNEMTVRLAAAQRRLRRSERIEAWREAAQRVAHEVKNPLFPIRLAAETVEKAVKRGHPDLAQIVSRSTETVLEEVKSIDRLVAEFSEFARLPAARPVRVAVDGILDRVRGFDERVEVQPGPDIQVTVDPDLMGRALFNLVKNGLEASRRVRVGFDGKRRCFWVEDEGPGIPEDIREQLFEPYVTRRPGGTGLGLAVVERICLAHDAEIVVESPRHPGAEAPGSRFEIQLPEAGRAESWADSGALAEAAEEGL